MIVHVVITDWLLDGLAGFLTDMFIKQFLGNNEARYRRYKVYTYYSSYSSLTPVTISELNHEPHIWILLILFDATAGKLCCL